MVQIPLIISLFKGQLASSPFTFTSRGSGSNDLAEKSITCKEDRPSWSAGWDGDQSNRHRIPRQNLTTKSLPTGAAHTATLASRGPAAGRSGAGGVSSRGRRSPTCSGRLLAGAAGPLPALWRGLRVASPGRRLSGRRTAGSVRPRLAVLLRRAGERARGDQELKLLCKKRRRRAPAGRGRGCPRRAAAGAAARRWANLEVGVHVPGGSSVRPGRRPSVQCCPTRAAASQAVASLGVARGGREREALALPTPNPFPPLSPFPYSPERRKSVCTSRDWPGYGRFAGLRRGEQRRS